jgi:hypothetical protein
MKPPHHTVRNERLIVRYPWLVVDAAGEPALVLDKRGAGG